jgi:hypothetical protein
MKNVNNKDLIAGSPSNEQIITLKSVYGKLNKVIVYPVKDSSTGRYLGGVKLVDSKGDAVITHEERMSGEWFPTVNDYVSLVDGISFDLSDTNQKKTWEWLKHSTKIADSWEAAQSSPTAEFYIYIPEAIAQEKVQKANLKFQALRFVMEDAPENMYNIVKLLGHNMDSFKPVEVKEFLLNIVETNPRLIISAYTDSNMKTRLFILDAKAKGVIVHKYGVYNYGDETLGIDEPQVIAWLQEPKNKKIVDAIKLETYPEYNQLTKK